MRVPGTLLSTLEISSERDVVLARRRARKLGAMLGLDVNQQTRLATATSEIVRNAFRYAGGGRCEFALDDRAQALLVRVADSGPGIPNLDEILQGRFRSSTGMGLGLSGTRRLMDDFEIVTGPGRGTTVVFEKLLPSALVVPPPATLAEELSRSRGNDLEQELLQADAAVIRSLAELRARNEELERIRGELEETNRGVVALYAELDEKAESLRRATEAKSRFLSNMSHEFRTPLNSIHSLTRILLDGLDGALNEDQQKAVSLIRSAATGLAEMVNDLLDLARIAAGKVTAHSSEFTVPYLFGGLRGMLKPLVDGAGPVALVFEEPEGLPPLVSDEGKVSQILRNFVSNALKFTERGEVRVGARQSGPAELTFFVRDTGIGIAPADQQRIFDEFAQVDSALQRKVKGTGLGLPLSRKLAELLGGAVRVQSEQGRGSTFELTLPLAMPQERPEPQHGAPVLALVDDEPLLRSWREFLAGTSYHLVPARNAEELRAAIDREVPAAVIVGAFLDGAPTRPLVAELRKDPRTQEVPLLGVATAVQEETLLAVGADLLAPVPRARGELLEQLGRLLSPLRRVLIIAAGSGERDELRRLIAAPRLEVFEARDAVEGLRRARELRPRTVVIGAGEPGFAAATTTLLRSENETREAQLLVQSTRELSDEEAAALRDGGARVIATAALPREEAAHRLRSALREPGRSHG